MPQCVRLQEESFVFTYLFSASPPRLSPRPPAAVQALPLVRPQRRAPEPRDGRPPRHLLPLGTERPQDREFAGGGDISSLLRASLQPHGPHGAFRAERGAAGGAVTRVRRWRPCDERHGSWFGRFVPAWENFCGSKGASAARTRVSTPASKPPPTEAAAARFAQFSISLRRLTTCRGQAFSCH